MNNSGKDNLSWTNILSLESGLRINNLTSIPATTNINNPIQANGNELANQEEDFDPYQKTLEVDIQMKSLMSNLYPKTRYRSLTDSSSTSSVLSPPLASGSSLSLSSYGDEALSLASSDKDHNILNDIINKALNNASITAVPTRGNLLIENIHDKFYQSYHPDHYSYFQHQLDLLENKFGLPGQSKNKTIREEDEISKSLKMFALYSVQNDSKGKSVTDYELLKARSNVDDIMKEFNCNGYTSDDPLLQNNSNSSYGGDIYRLYQQQQQYNRFSLTPGVCNSNLENSALLYQQQQQQQQVLLLQQQRKLQTEMNFTQNSNVINNTINCANYWNMTPSTANNTPLADSCLGGSLALTTGTSPTQTQIPTITPCSEKSGISSECSDNLSSPTVLSPLKGCGSSGSSRTTKTSKSRGTGASRGTSKKASSSSSNSSVVSSKSESNRNSAIKSAKRYNVSAKHCVFCDNNNEPEAVVKSHSVRDNFGRVLCPKLRTYVCPICNASGDLAHTVKYCPKKPIVTMEEALRADYLRLNKSAFYKQQMKV